MTVATMSNTPNTKNGSKKASSSRAQHTIDPRLAIARLYHYHRLQREQALRLRPEPLQYTPRMDLYDDETLPNVSAMLELPGVDRRTLSLQVQDGKLVIHGERASPLAASYRKRPQVGRCPPLPKSTKCASSSSALFTAR